MVRNYKQKTNRANIDENRMRNAVQMVLGTIVSERVAAREFGINRRTLHSRIQKMKKKYAPEELA